MTAFVVLCVILYAAALVVIRVAVIQERAKANRVALDLLKAGGYLDERTETWIEDDWGRHVVADATAAHIARHAADDIETEWAELNRGVS